MWLASDCAAIKAKALKGARVLMLLGSKHAADGLPTEALAALATNVAAADLLRSPLLLTWRNGGRQLR